MNEKQRVALDLFTELIDQANTTLNFGSTELDFEIDDLLQAEDFGALVHNNANYFECIDTIFFEECPISRNSGSGLELLCKATKNVTELTIENNVTSINEANLKYLIFPELSKITFDGVPEEYVEILLQNHPNIETIIARVYLTEKSFSYMKKVVTLNLEGGGLDILAMQLLGAELIQLENEDCLLPCLKYLNISTLMDMSQRAMRQNYRNFIFPAIASLANANPRDIEIEYDMVAFDVSYDAAYALSKLKEVGNDHFTISGLPEPVITFLSEIQNSPFWKDQDLFNKYTAPSLIKMLRKLNAGYIIHQKNKKIKTFPKSSVLTDIEESVKGCSTNGTGTILAFYALDRCNAAIEELKKKNKAILNVEILSSLKVDEKLMNDIIPVILTEYLNSLINLKLIKGDRSELIAAALNILAGKPFFRKEKESVVSNPIRFKSMSNFNFKLTDLELDKFFDVLLEFNTNNAAINPVKLSELMSTYFERCITIDNKVTWAINFKETYLQNDALRKIFLELHKEHEVNYLIHRIAKGEVVDEIDATNAEEYVTNVTNYLQKLANNASVAEEKETTLISNKRKFEAEDFFNDYSENEDYKRNKKQKNDDNSFMNNLNTSGFFTQKEGENLFSLNDNHINKQNQWTVGPKPTLKEIRRKINDNNVDAIAFEPTDEILGDVEGSLSQHISNNIRGFLNENRNINNFICLLPDNYTLDANGGHFICILRKGNTFKIFDPLNEENAQTDLFFLISQIKIDLGYECIYGSQDFLDADQCGNICIKYIKGTRASK
jgi:hypothetical protein